MIAKLCAYEFEVVVDNRDLTFMVTLHFEEEEESLFHAWWITRQCKDKWHMGTWLTRTHT